jgi:membrane protein required for colicin V production
MDNLFGGALTYFDVIVLGVVALSALMSLGRGLIREATSVLSFIVGGLAAYYSVVFFEDGLKGALPAGWPPISAAVILVVVGFMAAYWLAAFLGGKLSRLINVSPEFGTLDRVAGAAFGAVRGILAAVLFVLLLQQVLPDDAIAPGITGSALYSHLDVVASWIRDNVPGFVDRAREAIQAPVPDRTR